MASIKPSFLYGVRSGVDGGVHFTGDSTVLYPAGSGVARVSTKDGSQELVSLANKGKRITALALNSTKKLVAFTEYGDRPLLIVYDLETHKRKKLLRCAEFKSKEVVSLAFSHDSKYLLAQGGAPDFQLVYFFWEKGKVITTSKTVTSSSGWVTEVSFHPKDHDVVCIVGKGIFRLCRLIEGVLKTFGFTKGDQMNCFSHDWLSPRHVLVATEKGKVLLFEDAELKSTYSMEELTRQEDPDLLEDPKEDTGHKEIGALISYSGGFIASYGKDTVYVFEQLPQSGEEFSFKSIKKIKFPKSNIEEEGSGPNKSQTTTIKSLTMSPKEDLLIALTSNLLLYSFPMRKKESSLQKRNTFSIFLYPFHSESIEGLDVCHRKPLIVTCSKDHTIRVWNYKTFGMELAKKFREEIFSVAIHPDGLYIAAGFADKIRLLNILIDDMRLFHEFPVRECRVSLFSHGGHLLVAAIKDTINVYNTITFATIHTLKGHQGQVTCVSWSLDDLKLVSCADNGSLYEWNVATGERIHEIVVKTCSFSYLTLSPDSENIYSVGSDKTVKHMAKSRIVQEIDLHSFVLSSVCLSNNGKTLVSGSTTGAVQLFTYPLSLPGEWKEWRVHGDAVNFIKISHTNDILVTASKDGSFCVWDIVMAGSAKVEDPYSYALEILITKSELEEKNGLIEELKQKVDESKTECAYQLRLKDNQNTDMIKEINKKAKSEKETLAKTIATLQQDIENSKKDNDNILQRVSASNERTLLDQSDMYKSKLVVEYDKFDAMEAAYNEMKDINKRKTEELEKSIEQRVEKIKKEFDSKLAKYEDEVKLREKAGDEKVKAVEEILKQTEEDADKEILEMKTKYELELKKEKESNVKLRGELGILKKKHLGVHKDLEDQKTSITSMFTEHSRLEVVIKGLEKDIIELKREIHGRDETVLLKEREITELKRDVRSMDKYRFVLNHKIQLLEDEIQPKENKITEMKSQILAMEEELTAVVKDQAEFNVQMNESKSKLANANQDVTIERRKVSQLQIQMSKLQKEIRSLHSVLQDPKKLKDAVSSLCNKHAGECPASEQDTEGTSQNEVVRQKEYLEKTVLSLKNQLNQVEQLNKSNSAKMLKENKILLREIDRLKKEVIESKKFKAKLPMKRKASPTTE